MKVAHGYIEMAQEVVGRIASEPIKNHLMRLRIAKAKKALGAIQESWLEVKNELVQEFGTEVDGGIQIDPKSEGFEEFREAYDKLSLEETDLTLDAFPDALLNLFDLSADDIEILLMVGLVKDDVEAEAPSPVD